MHIHKGQRWLCFFYCECARFDIVGGVWKDQGKNNWTLEYTLRGVEPDEPPPGLTNGVYSSEVPDQSGSEKKTLENVYRILNELCSFFPLKDRIRVFPILGDHRDAFRIIRDKTFPPPKKFLSPQVDIRYLN